MLLIESVLIFWLLHWDERVYWPQANKTQLNLTLCEKENWKTEKTKKSKVNFYFTVNKTILSATLRKTTTEAKKGDNRKWKRIKCIKKMASNQKVTNWQWRIFENFKESHIGIIVKWWAFLLERCCCCFFWFFLLQKLIGVSFTDKTS